MASSCLWDDKRVERCETHSSVEEEPYLSWSFGCVGPEKDPWRKRSQDVQWLLVALKDTRRNNLYYLKDSAVTKNLTLSKHLEDDSSKLLQMKLRYAGLDSLQALAK